MSGDDNSGQGAALPAAGSRVRSGLLWFGARSRATIPQIEPLVRALRANHPKADIAVVERAYRTAEACHSGQTRKSGEPYITHPVAVATILAEMGMTTPTLVAALLHDTVEDTDYTLDQLRAEYGDAIADLVDGVTKLDKVHYGAAAQSETLRKMLVAMSRDIRVLLIKLGDRLHNARTWRFVPAASAAKKAQETLEIYAPLAHRLGMNMVKWELEELSFKTLYPQIYEEIDHLVAERAPQREEYLRDVIDQIEEDLRRSGTKGTVSGRPKSHYSIYQKMIVRGKAFDEVFDLVAVRVLVQSIKDCYAVLGSLHGRWNPIPGRFKDYIAMPKFNLYQSLHTTVVGPGGKPVEIQIRTFDMHERAEHGVAAHWKYKQNPNAQGETDKMGADEQANWLRALVEMERETGDPEEFLDSLRYEIAGDEVYVFTPKGEVVTLPARATPVDFAYAVHTEVGHRTVGARVNSRLVPLDTRLENGDTVEVFTSKAINAGPSRDWLSFVASTRARNKIRSWFSKERREEAIEEGKGAIARTLRKQNLPLQRLMSHETLMNVAKTLDKVDIDGLYAAVGEGHVSAQHVVDTLVATMGGEDGAEETLAEGVLPTRATAHRRPRTADAGVVVAGMDEGDVYVKLARCCTPMPGDPIVGFITRGSGVSVHRADCQNVDQLQREPERLITVSWADHAQSAYLVQVEVEALDRGGLLADITRALADSHVNLVSASIGTSRDRVVTGRFVVELAEAGHLDHTLAALRRIDGVFEARRSLSAARRSS